MRPTRTLALVALMLLAMPLALAQEKPAEKPAAKSESKSLAARNYFVYYSGSCIGWQKSERNQFERDGKTLVSEHDNLYVKIIRNLDGQAFEIKGDEWMTMNTDGTPVSQSSTSFDGGQVTKREATFNADSISVSETVGSDPARKATLDTKGKTIGTGYWAFTKLKAEDRLKKGETISFTKLDMDNQALEQETWTVSGSVTRKTTAGKVVEGVEIVTVSGGHVSRNVVDDSGMPGVASLTGGFSLEATEKIPEDFKPEPVEIASAMTSKIVVKDCFKLTTMDILIPFKHDDTDGIEPLCESNNYHDVVKYDDDKGSGYGLRLKAWKLPADFKAPALPLKDLPDDVKRYTTPTAICQSDDADLMKEAARLSKDETDSRKVAENVMRWVYKYLKKVSGDTGSASAKQAYNEKQGDCTEHAALFVAVARAAGLPARQMGGMVYLSQGNQALFGYHAWAEVWLGQWVPVDATVNELGTSARYVMYEISEPGDTAGSSRISRSIGQKIKPQIDAYETEGGTKWRRKDARELKFAIKPENPEKKDGESK